MSHLQPNENGNGNGNGRRWYDSSKIIAALASVVFVFVVAWATIVWVKLEEQDKRIRLIEDAIIRLQDKLK